MTDLPGSFGVFFLGFRSPYTEYGRGGDSRGDGNDEINGFGQTDAGTSYE